VCQDLRLGSENEIIPRIAFGFAGGIGQTGSVCGAVAGAVMAISLNVERGESMQGGGRALEVVAKFRRRFEAEMRSIECRELTGADFTTEEGIEAYMRSDTPKRVCFPAVGLAYRLVKELLREQC
jgi:C_GCAxxG_C_C family probable redox protein